VEVAKYTLAKGELATGSQTHRVWLLPVGTTAATPFPGKHSEQGEPVERTGIESVDEPRRSTTKRCSVGKPARPCLSANDRQQRGSHPACGSLLCRFRCCFDSGRSLY
jgi:hypothetical protein